VQAQAKKFVGGWAAKSAFKPGYIKDVLVTTPPQKTQMSVWNNFELVPSGAATCKRQVSKDTDCKYYRQSGKYATEMAADGTVYFGLQITAHIEPPRDNAFFTKDTFIQQWL